PPTVARSPGRTISAGWPVDQADDPVHRVVENLSDVEPGRCGGVAARSQKPAVASPAAEASGGRSDPRCPAGHFWASGCGDARAERPDSPDVVHGGPRPAGPVGTGRR